MDANSKPINVSSKSHFILFLSTLAFTVCFAVWVLNGVLVTFLVDKGVFDWGAIEIGWLLGIPILTGSIFRLPMGILTDKYGGKWVFGILLLFCAIPVFLLSYATNFWSFALLSFCFGIIGSGFAVGIGFTSVWYPKEWQGRALGIFGAGNAGAALTTMLAPTLLTKLTDHGKDIEQWRMLPKIYAAALVVMAIIFLVFATNKKISSEPRTIKRMLQPLGSLQVWRFGLYYFLVFGCFVAFSQWLIPYFVNVYGASLIVAGMFATLFSMPSGLIRVLGGWMSDKYGGRKVMIWVFRFSIVISALLIMPKMEILTPGKGIQAGKDGKVLFVSESLIKVDSKEYQLTKTTNKGVDFQNTVLPQKSIDQKPVVEVGENVKRKQLIAASTTHINFEANMWVYAVLVLIIGIVWGIGKAGVYRFIPDYFPEDVGVVGGIVGVIGGLGGFVCPILFGYLLDWTGMWTSSWLFVLLISIICLIWMQRVVRSIIAKHAPRISDQIEHRN